MADLTPSYESEFLQQQAAAFNGKSQPLCPVLSHVLLGTAGQTVAAGRCGQDQKAAEGKWHEALGQSARCTTTYLPTSWQGQPSG